jgi:hypothetical protein
VCGNAVDENCNGEMNEGCCPPGEQPCPGYAICSTYGECPCDHLDEGDCTEAVEAKLCTAHHGYTSPGGPLVFVACGQPCDSANELTCGVSDDGTCVQFVGGCLPEGWTACDAECGA